MPSSARVPPSAGLDEPARHLRVRFDNASLERLTSLAAPIDSTRARAAVTARSAETILAPLVQPLADRRAPTLASPREPSPVDGKAPSPLARDQPAPITSRGVEPERVVAAAAPTLPVITRRALEVAPPSATNRAASRAVEPAVSAPVVQIRIGRVEVRAVVASPVPTRASAPRASGAISLEEHLRRKDAR